MSSLINVPVSEKPSGQLSVELSAFGSLFPILPMYTGRYNVAKRVERSHTVVEPGMFMTSRAPTPRYLPQQWSRYIHPEGQVYFCRNAQLRVVTDAYLDNQSIADKIVKWVSHIEKQALERQFEISESVELYLQLEDDDCNYYFVDHAVRTLFWLDAYETSEIGLLQVVSSSHLKTLLEEQYWLHLEYHSQHSPRLESNIIEEAISQLIHGCGDHLTSASSTFPYNAKECKRFLNLLVPARDRVHDGHIISLAARLNSAISANRYWTHYGQEQSRLSRSSQILTEDEQEWNWTQHIASAITLGTSESFRVRFNTIFNDNYVYEYDWRSMMTDSVATWRTTFAMSCAFLMLHIFCFYLPVSDTLALASGGALSLSLVSAALLTHRFEPQMKGTAGDAYAYLSDVKSTRFGFQGVALLFALPQIFNLWGLFLTCSQLLVLVDTFHIACCAALVSLGMLLAKAFAFGGMKVRSPKKEKVDDPESAL